MDINSHSCHVAFLFIWKTCKYQFSSSDETMLDNALYSTVHRETLHRSSFVMSNGINGSLPPLSEAQPSPYMQPEPQSDPPVRWSGEKRVSLCMIWACIAKRVQWLCRHTCTHLTKPHTCLRTYTHLHQGVKHVKWCRSWRIIGLCMATYMPSNIYA